MKRIGYIDIMKGIAILTVLIGHYMNYKWIGTIVWSFHMPLFIVLSGYFYKKRNFGDLLDRNFRRYMVPYLIVWGALILSELLIYNIFNRITNDDISIFEVVLKRFISGIYALASNTTNNKPDYVIKIGVIWFLNALFVGEILLWLVLRIKNTILQAFIVGVTMVIACIQTRFVCIPFGINYGCAFLGWLFIGYVARQLEFPKGIELSKYIPVVTYVIWTIVIVAEYSTNNTFNIIYLRFPLYGLEIIGAVCGILCVREFAIVLEKRFSIISSILSHLGRNTIWIMCVHAYDIELWKYVYRFFPIQNDIMDFIRIGFDIALAYCIKHVWIIIVRNRFASNNV